MKLSVGLELCDSHTKMEERERNRKNETLKINEENEERKACIYLNNSLTPRLLTGSIIALQAHTAPAGEGAVVKGRTQAYVVGAEPLLQPAKAAGQAHSAWHRVQSIKDFKKLFIWRE